MKVSLSAKVPQLVWWNRTSKPVLSVFPANLSPTWPQDTVLDCVLAHPSLLPDEENPGDPRAGDTKAATLPDLIGATLATWLPSNLCSGPGLSQAPGRLASEACIPVGN